MFLKYGRPIFVKNALHEHKGDSIFFLYTQSHVPLPLKEGCGALHCGSVDHHGLCRLCRNYHSSIEEKRAYLIKRR